MKSVYGLFGGIDRILTLLADHVLQELNLPVVGVKDLKRADEQQCVAKIVWHGMSPNGCLAHIWGSDYFRQGQVQF